MKTVLIFAYDIETVAEFLYILHPMVRKQFNFEVLLYTSYASDNTIGAVGITDQMIRDLDKLKSRYCWINEFKIHGLVASGPDVAPDANQINNFVEFIRDQNNELNLSGQLLNYEFSVENKTYKSNYTKMAVELERKIAPATVYVDTGSYRKSRVDFWEIYKQPIKAINTSMYSSSMSTFYIELYGMLASPIKHGNQIPAICFGEANVAMNVRMKRLRQFGYESIAIFNPNGDNNMYVRDIADFIETAGWNRKTIPTITGIGSAVIVGGSAWTSLWLTNMLLVNPLLQFWITGGTGLLSLLTTIILCRNMVSMVRYALCWFTSVIFVLSGVWLMYLYALTHCGGELFKICGSVNETTFGLPIFSEINISGVEINSAQTI